MSESFLLGIDAGGTHTDAVLMALEDSSVRLIAQAKVSTRHEDLPRSIREVIEALQTNGARKEDLQKVLYVTLGTTLAVNALVQGKNDAVGLLLTSGSGLSPRRFVMDDNYAILPGGLDHRGIETSPLDLRPLPDVLRSFSQKGIHALACVGKFSPREPRHEDSIAKSAREAGFQVTLGHRLSGQLNFPRRIATAWFNASVERIQNKFLDAVEKTLADQGITAPIRLLKADGGSIPLNLARKEPVQSILSGPAASVMGSLALSREITHGATLLLDIGGTTTDIALIIDGSPVIDRDGMMLQKRRTLVRALASLSIGVGGDSSIRATKEDGHIHVETGPERLGPAMAFGGESPTLLDALNVLDQDENDRGDVQKSLEGISKLAESAAISKDDLAMLAVQNAMEKIVHACSNLLKQINGKPIYTLAQLRNQTEVSPERILLVGGPAKCIEKHLFRAMNLPIVIPSETAVCNAIGACLTRPTESLEVYADTGKKTLRAPRLDHIEPVSRQIRQADVEKRACALLEEHLSRQNIHNVPIEVLETDLFATLDDYGTSSKDIRVTAQAVPGIIARVYSCA